MKSALIAAAALMAALPAVAGGLVSTQRPETQTTGVIGVGSSAFAPGAAIPLKYSTWGQNISPPLKWTTVGAAKSYAILVDDPDGPDPQPVSHWAAWNIPAGVTVATEGAQLGVQGINSHRSLGYSGPHPPAADPPHHYHFQVLALDRMLNLPAGAERDALLAAAKGHVIAKGEVVGTFKAPRG
ncbi:YbhB/YbcL family Raf kinase inhibitor-like protein [Phenylobacterium sp.]|uniref:YbhB/YbcL family Raf kinase inhibitor-like protein n=1 Tax=Phenylobacterium sp. TaxID=1871053 RepID=UPI00120C1C1A|nr:YbhB/YbcL family Raf kinase inhibitor-like protein [Phenylobacterium sp.]THD59860.1 MAG: YbhB/YbcL family Raf kinase inhibitor-like protein [Phenylobacterium sp.]